jgi:L-fuculose-phosphate aldolase
MVSSSYGANVTEKELRAQIVDIGRRLYERRFIVAGDGNISVRTADGNLLVTPTAVNKGFLTPDMLVKTTLDGAPISGEMRRASSEIAMHAVIYQERPDVRAVVHAHPPIGTGFAAAGLALDKALVSEVVLTLGCIPLADYGTPSTKELPEALRPLCAKHDAILLANHGAVAYGPDLTTAHDRMETLEHFAHISLVAHMLGGGREIPPPMIAKLIDVRERAGLMSPEMRCQACPYSAEAAAPCASNVGAAVSAPPVLGNPNESVTLTRRELVDLVSRATAMTLERRVTYKSN